MEKEELFIFYHRNDYFLNMVIGDNLHSPNNIITQCINPVLFHIPSREELRNTFNLYMLKIQWEHAQTEETWPIYNVNFILF